MDARALRLSTTAAHRRRRARAAVPIAVLIGTAALISAAAAAGGRAVQRDVDRTATAITESFEASVNDATALLTAARGLFHIASAPTSQELTGFLASATDEADVADGRHLPDVTFVRATRGTGRYVVALATAASETLLDVDVGTIATHRAAADAARDTGLPAATGWIARLSDPARDQSETGRVATLYVPVYRTGRVPATIAARRASIAGWTTTRLDAGTLFAEAGITPDADHDVTLYAGEPSAATLVQTSRDDQGPAAPRVTATRSLAVGGHEWTVVATGRNAAAVVVTPLSGFLLVVALALVMVAGDRRTSSHLRRPEQPRDDDAAAAAESAGSPPATTRPQPSALPPTTTADEPDASREFSDRAAGAYAARVSHELRTPLNGVIGLTTLMLDDERSPIQRERLLTLREAGQHLLAIVDDLRDTRARMDGPNNPGVGPFRLGAVTDQVVAAYAKAADDKGLSLRTQIDQRFGLMIGDASQLRRMLQHLVDNAIAFTEHGSVEVVAELADRTGDRCTIRIAVGDTGPGLDPDVRRRLLAPHDPTVDPAPWAPGTNGLGLAICRQIVDRFDGTLDVQVTPGRGTTISCTFNLQVAGNGVESVADRRDARPPTRRPALGTSPVAVLLVEDDDINQVVARGLLEQLGYAVDIAADGIEAVDTLRRRPFDVVLMDCGMPRLDGYATTRHVRAMEGDGRHTPIIAMTAAALHGDEQRCLDAGMDDYLPKPVTIDALAAALQRAGLAPPAPAASPVLADVPADG